MMSTFNIIMLQGQGAQGGGMSFWIMIIAIFAIMYFFMIRPQRKKQKEIEKFRNSLQIGDNVITSGGIHGVVKQIDPATNVVTIEIASNVKIQVEKSCIYSREGLQQQA